MAYAVTTFGTFIGYDTTVMYNFLNILKCAAKPSVYRARRLAVMLITLGSTNRVVATTVTSVTLMCRQIAYSGQLVTIIIVIILVTQNK